LVHIGLHLPLPVCIAQLAEPYKDQPGPTHASE